MGDPPRAAAPLGPLARPGRRGREEGVRPLLPLRGRLRARRLAAVLLRLYPTEPDSPWLRVWAGTPEARALRVALVNAVDGLDRPLALLPEFSYSDYREGAGPGSVVDGVRSEDLMTLSYDDESFDLLITSETLEHVPDLGRALAEVRRVLRPGGRHVFTVPWLPGVPRTFARSVLGPDGAIEHRETPICHPGGDRGYPVFTEFGADLPELLEAAGFEAAVFFGPPRDDDVAQVIACRKPAS